MFCPVATGKSGSNWLDRLRSAKGFPTDDGLGLDHFLEHHNPPNSTSIPVGPASAPTRDQPKIIPKQNIAMVGIMTNVLAELFNMGNGIGNPVSKKCSRKQKNPKMCILPKSIQEKCLKKDSNEMENKGGSSNSVNFEEEKEKGNNDDGDLEGYSRTEVTVIDTSFPSWKFEKLLFRRKNAWKVREKKGKSSNVGRKKRKQNPNNEKLEEVKNKKLKVPFFPSDSSTQENLKQSAETLGENDKQDGASKETPDTLSEVVKKRSSFYRSARKSNCKAREIVVDATNQGGR